MRSCLNVNATMVANEFIDRYMAGANGEYVKVYLYILRHEGQVRDAGQIADDLNHTESDVKRAIGYWVRQGVLEEGQNFGNGTEPKTVKSQGDVSGDKGKNFDKAERTGNIPGGFGRAEIPESVGNAGSGFGKPAEAGDGGDGFERRAAAGSNRAGVNRAVIPENTGNVFDKAATPENDGRDFGKVPMPGGMAGNREKESMPAAGNQRQPASKDKKGSAAPVQDPQASLGARKTYTPEQVSRLADQEDFTQLLYISQKYMDKIFIPRECEVFAYLYDALHMSVEVLEYLVEYCVQNGHCSIRYLESVAINWHEKGIRTVDDAKAYTATFSKEGFAVMRAFGISDRRPGDSEQEMIRKWFREFGFTKDIVLEACSRTLKAIHKPSFSYADKILTDWKKGGVRVMADIQKIDQQRERDNKRGNKAGAVVKPSKNQFHNFEQRNTDYDAMVLERLKERLGDS